MRMNKKGALAPGEIKWIPRIVFLVIVFAIVFFVIQTGINVKFDEFDAQARILASRLIYTRDGISYTDGDTARHYPGVIDLEKFTSADIDKRLSETISYADKRLPKMGNQQIAARMDLYYRDKYNSYMYGTETDGDATAYYNRRGYDNWQPLAKAGYIGRKKGPGGTRFKEVDYEVVVKEGDSYKPGFLRIEVYSSSS